MVITISQISNATLLTVASKNIIYQMNKLSSIILGSAFRNTSSYNSQVEINLTMSISLNSSSLKVNLPVAQVLKSTNIECYLIDSSHLIKLLIQVKDNSITIVNDNGWIGNNTIVIYGFANVNFQKVLSSSDSIKISLINDEGYICAELYETKFLMPDA